MAKAEVTFTGSVAVVHVVMDGAEVPLVNVGEDKHMGKKTLTPHNPTEIKMRFAAPSDTDWALVVKLDGKKILDESGTSDDDPFRKTFSVPIALGVVA